MSNPHACSTHQKTANKDIGGPNFDPDWAVAFQRSLEILETLETDRQNLVNKQMESLTGDKLQRAKDDDEDKKRQYKKKKNRILRQQQDFRSLRGGAGEASDAVRLSVV